VLQIGASSIHDIDLFVVHSLVRYGVVEYFKSNGDCEDALNVESPEKFSQVVDDYLNLLIVLLSERSLSLGHDLITTGRREIIHLLALHPNGIGFSELYKSMPERLVKKRDRGTSFEEILLSVATLRMPLGLVGYLGIMFRNHLGFMN
jgi:E3 ubiquitin-protein ligase UBR1